MIYTSKTQNILSFYDKLLKCFHKYFNIFNKYITYGANNFKTKGETKTKRWHIIPMFMLVCLIHKQSVNFFPHIN